MVFCSGARRRLQLSNRWWWGGCAPWRPPGETPLELSTYNWRLEPGPGVTQTRITIWRLGGFSSAAELVLRLRRAASQLANLVLPLLFQSDSSSMHTVIHVRLGGFKQVLKAWLLSFVLFSSSCFPFPTSFLKFAHVSTSVRKTDGEGSNCGLF